MVGHHLAQVLGFGVEGGDEPDLPGHDDDGGVGGLYRAGVTQLRGAQDLLDLHGFGVDVAAPGPPQRCGDLGAG
jgi:hypothetical protein